LSSGEHILDNAVWHALTSTHAHFAEGTDLAKRYPPQVAAYIGLVDQSAAAYRDLAQIVPAGETARLWGLNLPLEFPGWTTCAAFSVFQMVSPQPITMPDMAEDVIDLTPADVPDMLELVRLTAPGPFFPRTIELGHYIGIRQHGQLVAMAGERVRPAGFSEVSAVCTHPDYRGRGYAGHLIQRITAWNRARGDVPFLHVLTTNTPAIRLYQQLGFVQRVEMHVRFLTH
jgi:GNAT superfamily N-acetyltransferase